MRNIDSVPVFYQVVEAEVVTGRVVNVTVAVQF